MFEKLYADYGNLAGLGGIASLPEGMDLSGLSQINANALNFGNSAAPTQGGLQLGNLGGAAPSFLGNAMSQLGAGLGKFGDFAAQNQAGLGLGFSAAKGIADTWNTMRNNKLQEKALNFSMDMQRRNYNNLAQETNRELSDRQDRRVAANGGAGDIQSRDEYMRKWSVK